MSTHGLYAVYGNIVFDDNNILRVIETKEISFTLSGLSCLRRDINTE